MAQRGRRPSVSNGGGYSRISAVATSEATAGHIRVVVRVRPENERERNGGSSNIVRPMDEHVLIFDPREQGSPEFYHGKRRKGRDFLKRKNKDMKFAFDRVFDIEANNEDIYEHTTRGIIDGLLDGFNSSVFAYGATGAGKTFTMLGSSTCPGVIFLTMMDLYKRIEAIKEEKTCDVAVSYLEVYNEQIRDLLMPTDYLPLREDPQKGVLVPGLSLHKPLSAEELLHMLQFGNTNRTQHPTDANAESSRSHAIFQVFVRQRDRTGNLSTDVRVAKMSLIDLAGSERATVTTNRGARFREGANINRSLLALGNCINALAEGKAKGYIPYRNSKLTRLLKDSLGGNCRTVMIAAVSPSSLTYEDTYNTLKYANRAKNIKANLKRNVVSVDFHVAKYAKIVEELRQEVSELKIKVKQYEEGAVVATKSGLESPHRLEIDRIQGVLINVVADRLSIRKEVMELEGSDRDLAYKIHCKERHLARISLVFSDSVVAGKLSAKLERYITNGRQRQNNIQNRKKEAEGRMRENVAWIERVETEMKLAGKDDNTPEALVASVQAHHLEVELRDTRRQVKYLKKLCRAQEREAQASEKLIHTLLRMSRHQHLLLKGHSIMTSDLESEFENMKRMVEGEKEVAWADQSTCGLDSAASSEDSENFNINELVEFPLLNCVPATPRASAMKCARRNVIRTPGRTPLSAVNSRPRPNLENMPKLCLDAESPLPKQEAPRPKEISAKQIVPASQSNRAMSSVKTDCVFQTQCRRSQQEIVSQSSSALASRSAVECSRKETSQAPGRIGNTTQASNTDSSVHSFQTVKLQNQHVQRVLPSSNTMHPSSTVGSSATLNSTFTASQSGTDCSKEQVVVNRPRINSDTVTKTKPATEGADDKENVGEGPREKNPRLGVVRAMDFSNMPVPSPPRTGKLTFAEAVKSPARIFQDGENFSPRSPLTSRENLPPFNSLSETADNNSKQNRRMTYAATDIPRYQSQHPAAASAHKKTKLSSNTPFGAHRVLASEKNNRTAEALSRLGLPSVVNRMVRSLSTNQVNSKPSYMQMTKAASRRQRAHRRSLSSENLSDSSKHHHSVHEARRNIINDTVHKQFGTRTLASNRSKSSSNLAKKSTFF